MSTTLEDLQRMMRGRLADAGITVESGIPTRRETDRAPMSFSQRLVWAHQQQVPESTANNICLTFVYTGPIDIDAIGKALVAVVARHEILRTTYHNDPNTGPYQRIHPDAAPRLTVLDLTGSTTAEAELESLVASAAVEPFDLESQTSIRLTLVRLPATADGEHRVAVVVAMQHIVWDGMTLPVIAADVDRFYAQALASPTMPITFTPLSPQFADYAEWEQDRFARGDHAATTVFWESQFSGLTSTRMLPYDRTPGELDATSASQASARLDRHLSAAAEENLRAHSARLKLPPFSVFLAAYHRALGRLTGRTDLLIGSTVANREEAEVQALIGNFSNSIVLRITDTGEPFPDFVRQVRRITDAAFEHRDFPFEHVIEIAGRVTGDRTAQPFDSLVLFLDQEIDGIALPGATMSWTLADKGQIALPLTVEAFMYQDHTEVQIAYQTALFDEATVLGLHDEINAVLGEAGPSSRSIR